jgi:hypothetical protein
MRNCVAVTVAAAVLASAGAANAASAACKVAAKVQVVSRVPALPGEPIDLNLRITNANSSPIQLRTPSEQTGAVRLFFSAEGAPDSFRKYRGPMWGMLDLDESPKALAAGSSINLSLRVLHQVWQDPFAFSSAGTYHAKLAYGDGLACPQGLETPTFDVKIVAPTGNDLAVWNAIKDCASCAFVLHAGIVRSIQADQDAVALLRSLAMRYPKSRYATFIRKQLDAVDGKSGD